MDRGSASSSGGIETNTGSSGSGGGNLKGNKPARKSKGARKSKQQQQLQQQQQQLVDADGRPFDKSSQHGAGAGAGDDGNQGNTATGRKKGTKKRKEKVGGTGRGGDDGNQGNTATGRKKGTKKRKEKVGGTGRGGGKKSKQQSMSEAQMASSGYYSAGQVAINDMMRRALEEEEYSAIGSVVDTDTSDDEEDELVKGIDRASILSAFRKNLYREKIDEKKPFVKKETRSSKVVGGGRRGQNEVSKRKRNDDDDSSVISNNGPNKDSGVGKDEDDTMDDESRSSEFGEQGSSANTNEGTGKGSNNANNATWVKCDKCNKWRRLRGNVDEKKLPVRWFCSMNKNDPARAKCSAPEEEYNEGSSNGNQVPLESATDHRIRKHLRLWVRRLQSNEAYERKLPTMTRGKKKSVTTNSKEPYEWVRCCNPSCGKFRAILRFMDASNVIMGADTSFSTGNNSANNGNGSNSVGGEWYCVLNTWDEKVASCAAPQENLPVDGCCPPWVLQDQVSNKDCSED